MLKLILLWGLQGIVVAGGIWMFLRFVRMTRGSRLIRGLFLTVVVGIAGIWVFSRALDLDALEYLVTRAIPFIVITFAIVFQPELRRAMAQLGERSVVNRLISRSREATLSRIVRAARAMAHRRHGALIAFEREGSLNTYIESGTQIDAQITARLIESLFNPSGPLHDGAVIVRGDRLAAAGCFFPLPQEADLDPSFGTRHRSAVGITEESDSVVLVVSEETGRISIARDGKIQTRIPEDEVEATLKAMLQNRELNAESKRPSRFQFSRDEIFSIGASILLAAGLLFFAHQNLVTTSTQEMRIVGVQPSARREPRANEILVVLPLENERLLAPRPAETFTLSLTGSRSDLDRVQHDLSGVYAIDDASWDGGDLQLSDVDWGDDTWMIGIKTLWKNGQAPELHALRYKTLDVDIDPQTLTIDTTDLNPRYVLDMESVVCVPTPMLTLRGPAQDLEDPSLLARRLEFEPIRLSVDHVGRRTYPLRLSTATQAQGFELVADQPTQVACEVVADVREIGTISADIAIVSFDPSRAAELGSWSLPPNQKSARFTIQTRGLFDADADLGTPAMIELKRAIRQAVERELNVYVDLAELPPEGGGSTLPVRTSWRTDFSSMLESLNLDVPRTGTREALSVRLESDTRVLLSPKTP